MAHTCGAEPVKTSVPIKKAASASHTGDGWHLQTEIRLMEEQKKDIPDSVQTRTAIGLLPVLGSKPIQIVPAVHCRLLRSTVLFLVWRLTQPGELYQTRVFPLLTNI